MKRRNFFKVAGGLGVFSALGFKEKKIEAAKPIELELGVLSTNSPKENHSYITKQDGTVEHEREELDVRPAIRPDRIAEQVNISHFCDRTVSRGTVVERIKDSCDVPPIVRPGQHGGIPEGIILNDVVDLDLTKQHINFSASEVVVGGKVEIMSCGYILSTCVGNPQPHDPAYYDKQGRLTTEKCSKQIGTFLSNKDCEGFVSVRICAW